MGFRNVYNHSNGKVYVMKRSKQMEKVLNETFPIERGLYMIGVCPFCHKAIDEKEFRDVISRKEFSISGLCQGCQDKVFG